MGSAHYLLSVDLCPGNAVVFGLSDSAHEIHSSSISMGRTTWGPQSRMWLRSISGPEIGLALGTLPGMVLALFGTSS